MVLSPRFRSQQFFLRPSQSNASFPIARPTHFWKSRKKIQNQKKQTLKFTSTPSCLIYTNCLKLSILRFCCLFRHLIVLLIYIFYHLTVSCRLKICKSRPAFTGTQTPLCVHSFFFMPDRPTDLHERESDGNETFYWDGLSEICGETVYPQFVEICMEKPCWSPCGWAPTWRPQTNRNVTEFFFKSLGWKV